MNTIKFTCSLALLFAISIGFSQAQSNFVEFIQTKHTWVDSLFHTLSPKERIGQLFFVRAHTDRGQSYIDSVANVIEQQQLGGIVLFQGGPKRHVDLINRYQDLAKVPLMVAIDGEWGLGMRLRDSTLSYPYQMTLGAIQNNTLILQMGQQMAKDFNRMGIHFNFAPVVDVNNNAKNPVINYRSFGEDKFNVAHKGAAYMHGLLMGGIIASLKHFPGHGDTDVDSHYDLPILTHSRKQLDALELYPFKTLIQEGAAAIMVAHMQIPSLDSTAHLASSLSEKVVTDLLKKELNFQGLIVTDAMDMKGATKYFPHGDADLRAILAGNDMVELSEDSQRAISLVAQAIAEGRIAQQEIDRRVKKILAAKLWLGLNNYQAVKQENLYADLHDPAAVALIDQLATAALTRVQAKKGAHNSAKQPQKTAIAAVGIDSAQYFERTYEADRVFYVCGDEASKFLNNLNREIKEYDSIILSIHDPRPRPLANLKINPATVKFIAKLAKNKKTNTILFANPYSLKGLGAIHKAQSLIVAYQNDAFMQKAVVEALQHNKPLFGKLPVTVNKYFKYGQQK